MKNIILILVLFFVNDSISGCEKTFINNIERVYQKNEAKYNRKVKKALKIKSENLNLNNIRYNKPMHIPALVLNNKRNKVDKDNFLCYLKDNIKMIFDESIVVNDTTVIGFIIQCPSKNCDVKYVDKKQDFYMYMKPLADKLLEINPDIVFTVYHIANAYWYIKNGELNILSFKYDNNEMTDFQSCNVRDFIQSLSDEEINSFLYFKKIKILSN